MSKEMEALEIIKQALERNVAKKPIKKINSFDYHCPNCDVMALSWNYCPNCGQKLDWGNEDE